MLRTLTLLAALLATIAPAAAADFTMDPPHTIVGFTVVHLAISRVHGTIPLASGSLTVGPAGLPTGAQATFDVKNLDSGDDRRNDSLRSPNFFDVAQYPTMTFVERSITGTPQAFTMIGDLTLHGTTKSITIKGSQTGEATLNGKHHVGYTGTTTIDRRDFGMTYGNVIGGSLIAGFDVAIELDVDAIQK
jgi:polyisoprenoid-binding protein YceI